MAREDAIKKNGSGCADPTAYESIKKVEQARIEESDRFHNLLDALFYITELAGFEFEERIVLRDLKTGKVWR